MFKTAKLSSFQHEAIAQRVRAIDAVQSGFADAWEQLSQRLLAVGGEAVAPQKEELASVRHLLERGELSTPRSVLVTHVVRPAPRLNALTQWLESRGSETVCVGYALSGDGLWRQHTWLTAGNQFVDVAGAHLAYFGVALSLRETAEMFVATVDVEDLPFDTEAREFLEELIDTLMH